MTDQDRARIRAEAKAMPVEDLRAAHARALASYAAATTPEAAQHSHEAACEYAEAYQHATSRR